MFFLKNKKFFFNKCRTQNLRLDAGMTYIELIVVLSIFSIMSSIVLFNYDDFQDRVDIRVLSNDVALKVVEAQKASVSGRWDDSASSNWKPSYGLHFDLSTNNSLIYFADLNNNSAFDGSDCSGECLDKITITKGNTVSSLSLTGSGCPSSLTNLNIIFKRPDSGAIITSNPAFSCTISYAVVTFTSTNGFNSYLKVYPSGRIQIN